MNDLIDLAPPSRREHIVKHQVSGRVSDRFVVEMDTALYRFPIGFVKNHPVRHTRESGYPVVQRLPGFPHSRE
jgi:hypothetical protein